MNILLVTETYLPYISGVSTSTNSIAQYMASQGHHVVLINPKPVLDEAVKPIHGVNLTYTPSIPDLFYRGKPATIFPLAFPAIQKAMQKTKFDVVHIQEPGSLGLAALILAKIYKIPTVGALHFTPEQIARVIWGKPERLVGPLVKYFIRIIYNQYDAVMVPTQTFADFLKSVGVQKPISIVSNGVDTERFHPSSLNIKIRDKYNIPRTSVVFFFLGRLDRDKNVATLVKAMPYTLKNIRLLVVGKGKVEKLLHGLASKLRVLEKIVWVDYLSEEQMASFYHAADCFAVMSPYEVQSIVTLQAISCGLPVIAARAGALPELVKPSVNGFLPNTYDFKTLAAKMNILAKNKRMRRSFGIASRRIALHHDKAKALRKLELLYQGFT